MGDDYKLFLSDPSIQAVFVITPDRYHAQQTLDCLRAGKHVFCEKPMADEESIGLLKESIGIAQQKGLVLTSCHPRRFDPPFMWLKQELAGFTARFGKPQEFNFDFSYAKPTKTGLHTGLLADHLNHEIDLMHYLFEPQSFKSHRLIDTQDRYLISGIRDDNLAFSFGGTRMLESATYPESAQIRFAEGTVGLNAHSGTAIIYDHNTGIEETVRIDCTDYDLRFERVNKNFKQAIMHAEPNYLNARDLMVNTMASVCLTSNNIWRWDKPE